MELDPKYTFVALSTNNYITLNDKNTADLLGKWGLRGNIIIQNFSFNEPFHPYHKYNLAEAFLKSDVVTRELLTNQQNRFGRHNIVASSVEANQIPCSVVSMSFFDKLQDPVHNIVHQTGTIRKRYDQDIDGFLVSDNLRMMLLDEECPEYELYSKEERSEFIFRIFQLLVLGGTLCQYEDTLDSYLDVTKTMYKDLVRVQTQKNSNDLTIGTMVLDVVAKDLQGKPYYPCSPSNKQNVAFLLVDGHSREVTSVVHQYGAFNYGT